MSYFKVSDAAEPIEIFGHGGGEMLSSETGSPLLGSIPIDLDLGKSADTGIPLMVSAPDSEIGLIFQHVAAELSKKTKK